MKHHTETAYMVVLGLLIGVAGFAASLLPPLPTGMAYWAVCMVLSVLYPLLLAGKFKSDRADYEFRLLHWFPACIFALWMVLQLLDGKFRIVHILNLGFLFLWSLPLVALGIAFLIIFALHVIRRSTVRIALLSIFLFLFTVGAVASEAGGWNRMLQRNIFAADLSVIATTTRAFNAAKTYVASLFSSQSGTGMVAMTGSSSSASSSAVTMSSSSSSSSSRTIAVVTSSRSSSVSSSKPTKLPASGPETVAVLAATLMALYAATVHRKTKERGVA